MAGLLRAEVIAAGRSATDSGTLVPVAEIWAADTIHAEGQGKCVLGATGGGLVPRGPR
jgi:hypothetical protein